MHAVQGPQAGLVVTEYGYTPWQYGISIFQFAIGYSTEISSLQAVQFN